MDTEALEDEVRQLARECADEAAEQVGAGQKLKVADPMKGDRDALERLLCDEVTVTISQAAHAREIFADTYRRRLREHIRSDVE